MNLLEKGMAAGVSTKNLTFSNQCLKFHNLKHTIYNIQCSLQIRVITNSHFTFGLEEAVSPLSSVEKGVGVDFQLLVTFNIVIAIILGC